MPLITGTLTFTVGSQTPVDTTVLDVFPATPTVSSSGSNPAATSTSQLRRLVYPTGAFAPLIYESNPDVYTNFQRVPLDQRPRVGAQATLQDNVVIGWLGVAKDAAISERWIGSTNKSRVTMDFFLALQDYYKNPPINGTYIIWEPRDQTKARYNVVIEALTLSLTGSAGAGAGDYEFDYIAARYGLAPGTVELRFRLIGVVA